MASSDLDPIATLPAFSGKNFLQLQLGIFVASSDLSILCLWTEYSRLSMIKHLVWGSVRHIDIE